MNNMISIHSLVKRETNASYQILPAMQYFNPLPRKEGDRQLRRTDTAQRISIHSLVKRETLLLLSNRNNCLDFNPLPRKEGDRMTPPEIGG